MKRDTLKLRNENQGAVLCLKIIHLHSPKCTTIKLCVKEVMSGYNWDQWSPLISALAHKLIKVHIRLCKYIIMRHETAP